MDKKYRVKQLKTQKDIINRLNNSELSSPTLNKSLSFQSPQSSKSHFLLSISRMQLQTKKDELKNSLKIDPLPNFSISKILSHSPEASNRIRSKTLPEKQESNLKKIVTQPHQIFPSSKYPYYVSKSNKMIQTKQKLLKLKHNLSVSKQGTILESIQESIADDKLTFGRKMKMELHKNGNQSLLGYLDNKMNHKQIIQKNQIQNKQMKQEDFGNITFGRFDNFKSQKNQKMQSIKKRLKNDRKNQLPFLEIFTIKA